jgi:hypothetical protein
MCVMLVGGYRPCGPFSALQINRMCVMLVGGYRSFGAFSALQINRICVMLVGGYRSFGASSALQNNQRRVTLDGGYRPCVPSSVLQYFRFHVGRKKGEARYPPLMKDSREWIMPNYRRNLVRGGTFFLPLHYQTERAIFWLTKLNA